MNEKQRVTPDTLAQGPLFTPRQIYAASFLGSPIAAAWFISQNFGALSDRNAQRRVLWIGVFATVAIAVVAFFIPENFPNVAFPIAYSYAVYLYAKSLFGRAVESHLERGGLRGSWWQVIGISALCLLALLALIILMSLAFPDLLPQ